MSASRPGPPRIKKVPKAECIELLKQGHWVEVHRSGNLHYADEIKITNTTKRKPYERPGRRVLEVTFAALLNGGWIERDPENPMWRDPVRFFPTNKLKSAAKPRSTR